jgi:CSLREA domain-containing protein
VSGSFTVITTAYPTASLSETGSLPNGVTFTDNGNGTASLAGTPALGSAGSYPFVITASNGVSPNAMQNFTLTVSLPPTYVVTTNGDDATGTPSDCPIPSSGNTCTLRDALAAVAAAGAGNITFDPTAFATAQTITLTNGTLNVPTMTTITGATSGSGATLSNLVTVAGGGPGSDFPVFNVTSSAIGAKIANLIITNGYSSTTYAGGILNGYQSGLTVINSTISGNSSTSSAAGIFNDYGATLTVIDSSISSNAGAAIVSESGGTVAITSSTISGNSGTGIANAGSAVTINASTISRNKGGYGGGGINTSAGTVTLANSIVVGNFATSSPDIYGSYTDIGGNFVGGVNGVTASSVNLAALGNFGGSTPTMILLPGSSAICTGLASNVPVGVTTDQRGFALDPTCASGSVDAGAVQTNQYVVNTLVDSNDGSCTSTTCSLRDAIGAANSAGGDITFLSSLTSTGTPGTINLSSGASPAGTGSTLGVSGQANIIGPGANQLTVAGDDDTNVGSVLTVNSGAQVSLYGLTIAAGYTNNSPGGGGINNQGTLTVMAGAISGNLTGNGLSGAGIFNGGTLTLSGSTVSGNQVLYGSGSGGGIFSSGTLTLNESTVANNSVAFQSTGGGGGIFAGGGTLTLTGSTVSGNTAAVLCPTGDPTCMGGTGGGINNGGGTLTLENSIVAGNTTQGTANSGDCQNCGTQDSSNVIGGTPDLSPLQSNSVGATVATMIPLPGSPAICGGLASNIPSGTTTDERGFPNTNSTYSGYSPSTPCVDAGAVQTNYAIGFSTQPSNAVAGAALNPAPVVTLTESGIVFTAGPGTIGISDADADLKGSSTVSVATTGGEASFTNLEFINVETGDTLTATVALNPAISATSPAISSVSNPFNLTQPGPPFGHLDSAVDNLTGHATVGLSDSVVVTGWVADQVDGAPLSNVKVYIDSNLVGAPTLGIARPGVAAAEGAAYLDSGYQLSYSVATLSPGSHAVTVIAIDSGARSTTFGPLNFTVAATPPFGHLDSAVDSVTGNTTVGQSDLVVVKGWTADQIDGAPLSNVKVYIDGNLVGTPTLGIARPGVAAADGAAYLDSGYQLSYSAATLALGSHAVTVIAIDSGGRSTTFGPLNFTVAATIGAPPFGHLDSAVDSLSGKSLVGPSDSVVITGWVADQTDGAPLSNVKVYIDGNLVGTPTLGIARPGVAAAEGAAYLDSGYQLSYSVATLSPGSHAVTVIAIDSGARSTTFGPLSFTVAPTPPFGNLDSAVDSVTGDTTVGHSDSVAVRGWVADQVDGAPLSNVKVYIDGNLVGTPTLGIARPSVAAAYGAADLDSGYQLTYSAATLALGSHAVTVIAIDSGGRSTTFGPLNFTVQ